MAFDQEMIQLMADTLIASNRLGEPWRVTASDGTQNKQFPPGMYLVCAYDATCYAVDGRFSTLETNRAHRIEDGDCILWLSEGSNDTLTVKAESGGEIRVTPRRQS